MNISNILKSTLDKLEDSKINGAVNLRLLHQEYSKKHYNLTYWVDEKNSYRLEDILNRLSGKFEVSDDAGNTLDSLSWANKLLMVGVFPITIWMKKGSDAAFMRLKMSDAAKEEATWLSIVF